MGLGDYVTVVTAKVEIRRGPLAESPKVTGACSCLEGGREASSEGDSEGLHETKRKVTSANVVNVQLYKHTQKNSHK